MADENHTGAIGAVDVNMNGVMARSQALSVDALGKAFVSNMSRQAMMADRKFDEIGTKEAVATRYLTTGVPNEATAAQGV